MVHSFWGFPTGADESKSGSWYVWTLQSWASILYLHMPPWLPIYPSAYRRLHWDFISISAGIWEEYFSSRELFMTLVMPVASEDWKHAFNESPGKGRIRELRQTYMAPSQDLPVTRTLSSVPSITRSPGHFQMWFLTKNLHFISYQWTQHGPKVCDGEEMSISISLSLI